MSMTRTTIVVVTLALVMFVATFCAISYSRLVNPDATTGQSGKRSSRSSRRGFKVVPVKHSSPPSSVSLHRAPPQTFVGQSRKDEDPISRNSKYARNLGDARTDVQDRSRSRRFRQSKKDEEDRSSPESKSSQHSVAARADDDANRRRSRGRTSGGRRQRRPNATSRQYPRWRDQKWKEIRALYRRQLTLSERVALQQTFIAVSAAFRRHNVTYWMDGGTLLGSYRHHGLIRWDDDVDFVVKLSQKRAARRAIKSLAPTVRLHMENDETGSTELAWRIYATNGTTVLAGKRYRFPTVDLLFYTENATHVWVEPHNIWSYLVWPRRIVFPLHLRPFNKIWLPAPCNTRRYLLSEFHTGVQHLCLSSSMAHRGGIGQPRMTVPCRLIRRLPFVSRTRDARGTMTETLMLGNKTLHQYRIHSKC